MPPSAQTDELIGLQALRVIYYMDRGLSGHLPWTRGATLYDWMKSKIGGFEIVQGGSFCCKYYGPPPDVPPPPPPGQPPPPPPPLPPTSPKDYFIGIGAQVNDFDREHGTRWPWISGEIALFAHEIRHLDGFPHTSCCGIPGGCDQTFDSANLTPYAVQWWLNKLWLDGTINVGMECQPPIDVATATRWLAGSLDPTGYPARFCDAKPAPITTPRSPGGPCPESRRRAIVRR